ncbi:MAG: hypothetical protein C4576_29725 [Desulfobacteraceae bacterium]|nr:MAG: hypothetical protein C4576_29725 [Desulfobacteraceae bacterium]
MLIGNEDSRTRAIRRQGLSFVGASSCLRSSRSPKIRKQPVLRSTTTDDLWQKEIQTVHDISPMKQVATEEGELAPTENRQESPVRIWLTF